MIDIGIVKKETAFLVITDFKEKNRDKFSLDEEKKELEALTLSSGCGVCGYVEARLGKIDSRLFIGKGKVSEIAEVAEKNKAGVVIFNCNLSASQQRNLEDVIRLKTIDRTQLILDIFARHAKSKGGKIQVELAQLEYLLPRLKGKGIMLSRLGGGIGTKGPGEKKIEVDRRKIGERITRLKKELAELRKHRDILRRKRKREGFFLVSLVGYTSAGKTSLLNLLTGDSQRVEAGLFTTLDPLSRAADFEENVIFADTVGFIHDLPEKLKESFKATLEELEYADLLIHLVDVSRDSYPKLITSVNNMLESLGLKDKSSILVFNKTDKVSKDCLIDAGIKYPGSLFISVKDGKGIESLKEEIRTRAMEKFSGIEIEVDGMNSKAVNFIYRSCRVISSDSVSGSRLKFKLIISEENLNRLKKMIQV